MTDSSTEMKRILAEAWRNPTQPRVFYSANSAEISSPRLRALRHWDWTPQRTASPGALALNTCLFPLALGCQSTFLTDGKEWAAPLITDPAQVDALRVPAVWESRAGEVLRDLRAQAAALPPDVLIRQPDVQSPLNVAEMMWDSSFYLALVEEPAAVHRLLEKITDFIIAFVREVHQVLGARCNSVGFPLIWGGPRGTMIGDDMISLLSPEMHAEFSLPYVNRIADAAGPLYYHSCTWREKYFANIRQVRNVHSYNWNPGNSDDPALIIREFSGRALLVPHIQIDMHLDNDLLRFGFQDEAELLRYLLDHLQDHSTVYFWFAAVVSKTAVLEKMYDLLHERGHTPAAWGI
ncbi:MAG: hypothetical protein LBK71_05180 [Verrucomicrobiales bacterium]|nr:hypothetical protein [Verrucomicrobiales bacterium]